MTRVVALCFTLVAATTRAFTPGTDHHLMNATSGPIWVDVHSSNDKDITHFGLAPGYSVGFNGEFLHLRVRLPTGKILTFTERRLAQLQGSAVPSRGHWLVEDSGVRSVSLRGYMLAYRRFHTLWP